MSSNMFKNIMIVDDSATARMITRRCLEIAGYKDAAFLEAANGREALEKTKDNPIDLFVVDLNMPVMDGETLLKRIKSSPKLTHIPVLIVTSLSSGVRKAELMAMGALDVLSKPISPANLTAALGSFKAGEGWEA
jgi:two-component system chemotaxis response regulator CheY